MKGKIIFVLAAVVALSAASPPPKLPISNLRDLPVVTLHPYDEDANADQVVAAAFARAQKSHKRVLLDLGGNWCPDCIVLANFMRLPVMKQFLAAHYEIAAVDVGRFNKNLQIPARFGYHKRLVGVPTILVLTPQGKQVNGGNRAFALASARDMTPQALADYLAEWTN